MASQSKGGNWSLVVPCLCDRGKVLLITLVVDLGNGGWPRPPQDLPFKELSFIPQASLLISTPLGWAHLLRNGLLGPLLSA